MNAPLLRDTVAGSPAEATDEAARVQWLSPEEVAARCDEGLRRPGPRRYTQRQSSHPSGRNGVTVMAEAQHARIAGAVDLVLACGRLGVEMRIGYPGHRQRTLFGISAGGRLAGAGRADRHSPWAVFGAAHPAGRVPGPPQRHPSNSGPVSNRSV